MRNLIYPFLLLLSIKAAAVTQDPTTINLQFNQTQININFTKQTSDLKFEGTEKRGEENILKFRLSPTSTQEAKAILIKDFKGQQTLEDEIKSQKYEVKPQLQKLKHGNLYSWTTPTTGAMIYYYLENPKDSKIALKIGPIDATLMKNFILDWAGAKWTN